MDDVNTVMDAFKHRSAHGKWHSKVKRLLAPNTNKQEFTVEQRFKGFQADAKLKNIEIATAETDGK